MQPCVLVGQLGVVRDHDDQAIAGHVAQQVHDLNAGLGVEGAGGFIREEDLGVVDEGSRNGDALHLAARHLRGFLVDVVGQADASQGIEGALTSFGAGDARQGQGQLDIGQDALVRDQVVGLEDEADAVVSVRVPVARLVILRGDAVDHEVAALEAVQASDDVEHRRLARAGLAQHGDEFVVAEGHGDLVECYLHEVGGLISLDDFLQLKHASSLRFVTVSAYKRSRAVLRADDLLSRANPDCSPSNPRQGGAGYPWETRKNRPRPRSSGRPGSLA